MEDFEFTCEDPLISEEILREIFVDISHPESYTISYFKIVQARHHRKRRINKKWLKKYGYKQVMVQSKGWEMVCKTDGSYEFVKRVKYDE